MVILLNNTQKCNKIFYIVNSKNFTKHSRNNKKYFVIYKKYTQYTWKYS